MLRLKLIPEQFCPDFNTLWQQRPVKPENREVLVKQDHCYYKKTIFRYFQSYLRIPGFDPDTGKSYMFSGSKNPLETYRKLPEELNKLLNFVNNKNVGYDNCVVNWYEPEDYIEPHSDCTAKLNKDASILIANFNEPNTEPDRFFEVENKQGELTRFHLLDDRLLLEMPPGFQEKFRHGVRAGKQRRISVSFRKLK